MYCPKCTIDIDYNGALTCPYCSTPLVEIPEHTNDASTRETINFQIGESSSSQHQSQSRELLDKAFEEIQVDAPHARAPGSKSLAITALLGALLLLSAIGTGIYYLNHTKAEETAVQTPVKILQLPSSEAPAPALKHAPLLGQKNQEDATHTAQNGSQPRQDISSYQTPVQDATRETSDSHEPKDVQGITAKEAPAAGLAVPQKNMPPSGGVPSSNATPQTLPPEMQARPRDNNKDSSGTIATTQSSNVSSSTSGRINSESGSHILLCGSFQSKEKALKQAARIKAKGYMPFVEKADLGSRGIWYRIKIAGFISKDAAEKARTELNRTLQIEAIVAKRK